MGKVSTSESDAIFFCCRGSKVRNNAFAINAGASCPNCQKKFDKAILQFINDANDKMKIKNALKKKKETKKQKKKEVYRKQIKQKVYDIIIFREKFIKPKIVNKMNLNKPNK